jgi:hypothetical protein
MQSEKPKKVEPERKPVKPAADLQRNAVELTLFCLPTSGSTAINYLAQDPDLAEKEAAVIFDAAKRLKK